MPNVWVLPILTGALFAISAPLYAADNPRQDVRYQSLVAAFSAAIAEKRPLEESCTVLHGPTGNTKLDLILKPYFERQAIISHGAARFPIVDCTYTAAKQGRSGRVIMMNPTADQLAVWIVTACTKAGVRPKNLSEDDCMAKSARMIWFQSNAQYPITGYVPEPANLCDESWPESNTALFGFRDGVTVGLDGTPHEAGNEPKNPCETDVSASCTIELIPDEQIKAALSAKVTKLAPKAYARLSNLPLRAELDDTPENHCPAKNGDPPEWLTRARTGYLNGLGANSYDFLEKWITSDEKEKVFTCRRFDDPNLLADCTK
jgi:hypothetical protein